jgi:hypothetical protein
MSAPHTDPEKQARRHKAPLWGMALAVVFGVAIITWFGVQVAQRGNTPDEPAAHIDGRTGEQEPTGNVQPPADQPPAN